MSDIHTELRINPEQILYLTDFSKSSDAALPLALAVAREYHARLYLLHVLLPDPYVNMAPEMAGTVLQAREETAKDCLRQLAAQIEDVEHETVLMECGSVWEALGEFLCEHEVDLIIAGTHGRTGTSKYLMGSVAEEIVRQSPVPVLTVGPFFPFRDMRKSPFKRVLFATDFSRDSLAAAVYAISFAKENHAELILVHVIPGRERFREPVQRLSVAEALHRLDEVVPVDTELEHRPEMIVEHGEPAAQILQVARQKNVDLIVLSVRETSHPLAAAHLSKSLAHKIVTKAPCSVLTVRQHAGVVH